VIVITLLCLWDEIYLWGKINPALRTGEIVSTAGMIFYLIISGIIPIRILIALQPPVNIINMIIGTGSIAYFIYSVIQLLRGLF